MQHLSFFRRTSRFLRFLAFFSSWDIVAYLVLSLSLFRCSVLLFAICNLDSPSAPPLVQFVKSPNGARSWEPFISMGLWYSFFLTRFTFPQISCIFLFLRHRCIPCSFPFPLTLFIIMACWRWIGYTLSPWNILWVRIGQYGISIGSTISRKHCNKVWLACSVISNKCNITYCLPVGVDAIPSCRGVPHT